MFLIISTGLKDGNFKRACDLFLHFFFPQSLKTRAFLSLLWSGLYKTSLQVNIWQNPIITRTRYNNNNNNFYNKNNYF